MKELRGRYLLLFALDLKKYSHKLIMKQILTAYVIIRRQNKKQQPNTDITTTDYFLSCRKSYNLVTAIFCSFIYKRRTKFPVSTEMRKFNVMQKYQNRHLHISFS